jgi:hypothetical protein
VHSGKTRSGSESWGKAVDKNHSNQKGLMVSLVSQAINKLSQGHSLARGIDFAKVSGDCGLASGTETTFVAMFCSYIKQYLTTRSIGTSPEFHEFFYIPSRPAESKVGYDLSIGWHHSDQRIRTMHKVLYARYPWCDEAWEWTLTPSFDAEGHPSEDYGHLLTLLDVHEQYPALVPYLVLNVCHCIHDYRSMGAIYNEWQLPPFSSLLRTIVVNLTAVCRDLPDWRVMLQDPGFRFVVVKQAPRQEEGEPAQEYLHRIGEKRLFSVRVEPCDRELNNAVLTLDDLCQRIERLALINQ